ncbi:MAG: FGGY family carbohydrate kinase [Leptospirillia bacterium]
MATALAAALDLGSTRIKAALLDGDEVLHLTGTASAPPLYGSGAMRECDPLAYAAAADELLFELACDHPGMRLGIASQRSSFLIWERSTGAPRTPLVSWQDRRAADWCKAHQDQASDIQAATGLVLSPHYLGPKLAVLLAVDPALREGLAAGTLRVGTLETWLTYRWTRGAVYRTDFGMAARSQLADVRTGDWSEDLCRRFGVPRSSLPEIAPTTGAEISLSNGMVLTASVTDQAAGVLAALPDPSTALVNLGTGGFVLHEVSGLETAPAGYLIGPLARQGDTRWAVEGTINGIGPFVEGFGPGPTALGDQDTNPAAFCLPDSTGIGAPHWRPDLPPMFSPQAKRVVLPEFRRVALEGVVFRVQEIVEELGRNGAGKIERLRLSGGLTLDSFVAEGIAACSGLAVERLAMPEASLLGAVRLAAGVVPYANPDVTPVTPAHGRYLAEKYHHWRAWLVGVFE